MDLAQNETFQRKLRPDRMPIYDDDMKRGPEAPRLQTKPVGRRPVRWDEVPHAEILERVYQVMALRSAARAEQDTLRFHLQRRLPRNDPADHARYIEVESAIIVETLRHLRDQYRTYFEERGCNPIAEMYWVVARYGVKDWGIMALRSATVEYIAASQVDSAKWNELFDFSGPYNDMLPAQLAAKLSSATQTAQERLSKTISALLPQRAMDLVFDGGPFGREYQMHLARSYPGRAVLEGLETFPAAIARRQKTWDEAQPWTEGLAALFQVVQNEVFSQFAALGFDAREAERRIVELSAFEQISYKHYKSFGGSRVATKARGEDFWLKLMFALD